MISDFINAMVVIAMYFQKQRYLFQFAPTCSVFDMHSALCCNCIGRCYALLLFSSPLFTGYIAGLCMLGLYGSDMLMQFQQFASCRHTKLAVKITAVIFYR